MDTQYTIKETILKHNDSVQRIEYRLQETVDESAANETSSKSEQRILNYKTSFNREQYQRVIENSTTLRSLTFDQFVKILRPLIVGFYSLGELYQAFKLLDRSRTGAIRIEELDAFIQLINPNVKPYLLNEFIQRIDSNNDGNINYDEFRSLVLRGIGRDIICSST